MSLIVTVQPAVPRYGTSEGIKKDGGGNCATGVVDGAALRDASALGDTAMLLLGAADADGENDGHAGVSGCCVTTPLAR